MLHGGKAAASFGKADVFYRYPKPKNDLWRGLELRILQLSENMIK